MSSVDSRIVTMKFDNAQFEQGANKTISTLDRLKTALHLNGATKGLNDVQAAADKTHLGVLEGGVTKVNAKFLAMATIAITALTQITQKAMAAGAQIVKSLTLQPIKEGFNEYEIKMGSIQTILANTAKYGTKLDDVTKALDELNVYADKTIYNFADMTKNIGFFTNSGLRIEESTSMIKGFSNAAAASGTSSQGAASAAYQLSQALSTGVIRLMDWKSLTNVGMGNKNMQTSLIEIANAMGAFEGTSITAKEAADNFNASLEKEWLTKDVMAKYLQIMANDVTPAQMKALGLSDELIKKLQAEAKTAEEAATKVRTLTQLYGTLKESVGSGWAETFNILFGNFDEATKLFTDINNVLSEFVQKSADARNNLLQGWKDLGGRNALIQGIKQAFLGILSILKPIGQAFRDIFPATTAKRLYELTIQFKEFAQKLKIGSETADKLRDTFRGVFAIFSIIGSVIKGVVGVLFDLVGVVTKSSGGFLTITANLGNFLTGIEQTLKDGDKLGKFFDGLSIVLQTPVKLIQALATYLGSVFSGFNSSEGETVNSVFERMAQRVGPLALIFEAIHNVLTVLSSAFQTAAQFLAPYVEILKNALSSIGRALKEAFSGSDISKLFDMINTGLFAALVIAVRKFLKDFNLDFGGGFIESIKETFGAVTGTLQAVQQNLRANVLLKIAAAIGALALAIVALSLIDSKKLTKAMFAISAAFAQLVVAMGLLTKIGGMTGFLKIPIITSGMILLSTAIIGMAQAIKMLSRLDWNGLAKGLVGVAGSLGALVLAVSPLAKQAGGMISAGLGVVALAFGMKFMADSITKFAKLDLGEIAKGLVAVTATLVLLGTSLKTMPPSLPVMALGLIGLAGGMMLFASAIVKMADIHFGKLLVSIGTFAATLVGLGMAIKAMPPDLMAKAVGLGILSLALVGIASAMERLGSMSGDEIAKSLITLAGALAVLGTALTALSGTIMGAAAILAVAVALNLLVPALKGLGNLSLKEIGLSLIALAGSLTVLGIAAYLIGPLSVVVLALAGSLALLGVAVLTTGVGMLAFAKAIEILVKLGGAAAGAIGLMMATIVQAIPQMMTAFAAGIVSFTKTIVESAPLFARATLVMFNGMLDVINQLSPKIAHTMSKLLNLMLDYLMQNSPKLVKAAYKLMMDFMTEIRNNIYQIISISADIMKLFIKGIGDKAPQLADEGAKTVIKLINAIANAIRNNTKAMNEAGRNLASAIVTGFISGITSGGSGVAQAMIELAKKGINAFKKFLGIQSPSKEFAQLGQFVDAGLAQGIDNYSYLAEDSVETMGNTLLKTMKVSLADLNTLLENEVDSAPVIAPVLDLSKIKGDAKDLLTAFVQSPEISPSFSTYQATSIANDQSAYSANVLGPYNETTVPQAPNIKFEQNNYSPKALSEVELYRQTRNQLALAKGVLTS